MFLDQHRDVNEQVSGHMESKTLHSTSTEKLSKPDSQSCLHPQNIC